MTDETTTGVAISIDHVGPVTEFEYAMTEPGLHVLRGQQGAGKTTILRTVQWACDGRADAKPQKTDGAKKGVAVVAGKTLSISRAVREEGDLTIAGMGDLDISTLHNPGHKTPATRDKYRIATLVRMAGVTPDVGKFKELVSPLEWQTWVDETEVAATGDLVDMAAKVKRDLDRYAKNLETQQENAEKSAAARADLYEGINVEDEHDEAALQERLEVALQSHMTLIQRASEATKNAAAVAEAARMIAAAESGYKGPSATAAEAAVIATTERATTQRAECERISKELRAAQEQLGQLMIQADRAKADFEAASRHEQTLADWRETVANVTTVAPDDGEMEAAETVLVLAREQAVHGAHIRAAIVAKAAAAELSELAKTRKKEAKRIRAAAAATQEVISEAIASIPNCPLRVTTNEDGEARLVISTDRGEAEPFDELSDGERWRTIVPLCCEAGRLVVLPQAAYGELANSTRSLLDVIAAQVGAYILTAQADDGELRAERFRTV